MSKYKFVISVSYNTILPSRNMDECFGDLNKIFPKVTSSDGVTTNYCSPFLSVANQSSSSADSTSPESYPDVPQSNTRLTSLSYDRTALYERTQSFERQEDLRIPPYNRAQNSRTQLQNDARHSFDEQPQFNMSPPSGSTSSYQRTPYSETPVRGPFERTPLHERVLQIDITPPYERPALFERMKVDRALQFGKTPPYESTSQFETLPSGLVSQRDNFSPYTKTSQVGSNPPYERVLQIENTPPFQRTPQFEMTSPYERVSQLEKTPPYQRNSQFERSPSYESTPQERGLQFEATPLKRSSSNESTSQFERTSQLGRTPIYESTSQFDRTMPWALQFEKTPSLRNSSNRSSSQIDITTQYERALLFEKTPLQSSSSSESTLQFERTSQFGRTPPNEKTSQLDRTPLYESTSQFGRTPPHESTPQFGRTPPRDSTSQFGRTPPRESTSQFGRTPPRESTSQFGRTPPRESTSQFGRTPPHESTPQFGRTPPRESTPQFGRTPPNENISQFGRIPPYERVSQFESLLSFENTSPYKWVSQNEYSTIFNHYYDARLDAEAKDFIPLAMRHQRPIVGRKFLQTQPKCEIIDEIENIWQNAEQKSYELFPSGNSCFGFSTPVRNTTSNLPSLSLEPNVSATQVPDLMPYNPTTSTEISSKMCSFCKKNGERPNVYSTHSVKEKIGKRCVVTCPILRRHVCETCGATQDDAHTITYCPVLRVNNNGRPLQSTTITLKNTRIKSNGRRRF